MSVEAGVVCSRSRGQGSLVPAEGYLVLEALDSHDHWTSSDARKQEKIAFLSFRPFWTVECQGLGDCFPWRARSFQE